MFPNNDIRLYKYLSNKSDINGIIVHRDKSRDEKPLNLYISIKAIQNGYYEIDNVNIFDLMRAGIHDCKNPLFSSTFIKF